MTRLRATMERVGHVLFRTRNALFPALFLATVALLPPPRERPHLPAEIAVGLALLLMGQTLRVVTIGFAYIKRGGKDGRIYASGLVTGGLFAHCRNPMYAGNLLAVSGLLVLAGNPCGLAAGAAFFLLAYVSIILAEETYLAQRFGDDYRRYCERVPRLLPRFRGLLATLRPLAFDGKKVVSKEHGTLYLNLMLATGILAYGAHRAGRLGSSWPLLASITGLGTIGYLAARFAKKRTSWLAA